MQWRHLGASAWALLFTPKGVSTGTGPCLIYCARPERLCSVREVQLCASMLLPSLCSQSCITCRTTGLAV